MPKRKIDPYKELFEEICTLYEETLGPGVEARNTLTKANYWKIGRRIVDVEQGGKARAAYGANVIVRLSEDLTSKYGKGFKKRTVGYIRDFALAYQPEELDGPLTWSHYKALMSVENQERREQMEALAIEQNLVVKKLERLVKQVNSLAAGRMSGKANAEALDKLLLPRKARRGVYKVVVEDFGKREVFLDCGFQVQLQIDDRSGKKLGDGDYVELKNQSRAPATGKENAADGEAAAVQLEKVACEPGERYCYDGKVLEVVDGDTVTVRLDLGFGISKKERLRLRSVAAPELILPEGRKAREFIKRRLKPGDKVTVLTYGHDVHGRYVGDILYKDEGKFLNMECIKSGFSQYVDSRN